MYTWVVTSTLSTHSQRLRLREGDVQSALGLATAQRRAFQTCSVSRRGDRQEFVAVHAMLLPAREANALLIPPPLIVLCPDLMLQVAQTILSCLGVFRLSPVIHLPVLLQLGSIHAMLCHSVVRMLP